MTLKNRTFKNTYIGKFKKIPSVKNIGSTINPMLMGGFLFLPVLVQLLVRLCADKNLEAMAFRELKKSSKI